MEKMAQIRQILKILFLKSPDFYDKFEQVVNNIEEFRLLFTFIYNMQPNLAKLSCE